MTIPLHLSCFNIMVSLFLDKWLMIAQCLYGIFTLWYFSQTDRNFVFTLPRLFSWRSNPSLTMFWQKSSNSVLIWLRVTFPGIWWFIYILLYSTKLNRKLSPYVTARNSNKVRSNKRKPPILKVLLEKKQYIVFHCTICGLDHHIPGNVTRNGINTE